MCERAAARRRMARSATAASEACGGEDSPNIAFCDHGPKADGLPGDVLLCVAPLSSPAIAASQMRDGRPPGAALW